MDVPDKVAEGECLFPIIVRVAVPCHLLTQGLQLLETTLVELPLAAPTPCALHGGNIILRQGVLLSLRPRPGDVHVAWVLGHQVRPPR